MRRFYSSGKVYNCVTTFSSTTCGSRTCGSGAYNCMRGFEGCIKDKTCGRIICCDVNFK